MTEGAGGGNITVPTVSATESGGSGTISFNAHGSDNVGVTRVDFVVDGALKATDTTSPCSATLDSSALANGTHVLVAMAYDAAGNVGSSNSVSFSVSNDCSSTVELFNNANFKSSATSWTQTSVVYQQQQ